MIKLVIKNGRVVDHGSVDANWDRYKGSHEVVDWDGDTSFLYKDADFDTVGAPGPLPADPRTNLQKTGDRNQRYRRRRRLAHPPIHKILAMIYRDMKNGTTEYVDAVDAINANHPPGS